ncbi:threonyl-tRNA synthetase [Chthoniobacter flavus Ellin428]|uniref:Threonine--tRNA ligase n=1 Tax=Chthoniobacter flavus Ellin428 TaxID=497964 RepID=B4D0E5_9BACT|nr:threonine--tRNA ligase [Chthoniobacter flavus]EDY19807.1 threonyl-tRNA synthetase [Chthoniobacter flavus Ellin428]TCO91919.1 threonyl-tRNA synthetase [Chthoniobacter flavus]
MAEERKTLEQRHQMSDLERLRHSAAHVLATAILRIWPEAQFAAGPPVENGFYYDLEMPHRISPDDFLKIEEEMKKEIKANHVFERTAVSRDEAIALANSGRLGGLSERPGNVSKFKIGNLADIPEGEEISLYKNGDFLDLCAGPHVMRTGNIGAFRLTSVASAYYKGDEKNPQLQRIYGTAFKNKTEMEAYFTMLEEAKKRDHRKLGKELELFCFDDDVGPGLPLWLPRGTVLIEELEKLAKETEFAGGYDRVRTPVLARENMYLTSGHLPYYAESMFPPMELREDAKGSEGFIDFTLKRLSFDESEEYLREAYRKAKGTHTSGSYVDMEAEFEEFFRAIPEQQFGDASKIALERLFLDMGIDEAKSKIAPPDRYYLKAMNCPHHHKLFAAVPRSYRDLPLRLAEYGTCYRYEQSGELFGLMRVRSMQMNDAHIYCTEEQFESEFRAVNEMYLKYFAIFGIDKYVMRFSTHDPAKLGQKFVDNSELWLKTEDMVRGVLQRTGINFIEVPNEAAFYGPKIDVQVWSAIGREFTIATNQVDFAVPARFGLTYKDRDNTSKTPLCIHRAPLGTHERFVGFLIEHYAGNFPLWLSPEQVRVLPIGDEEPLVNYAKAIQAELRAAGVRANLDSSSDPIKAKIASAEQMKVHTMLVLGHRDLEAGNVSVRVHGKGNLGAKPRAEVIADLLAAIKERRA